MRRKQKITVALTVDFLLCIFSVWCAMFLRTETFHLTLWQLLAPAAASIVIFIPLMAVMGVYNEIARFAGFSTIYLIFRTLFVYTPIYAAILMLVTIESVPRSVGLLQPLILGALALNARLFIRVLQVQQMWIGTSSQETFWLWRWRRWQADRKCAETSASRQTCRLF